jgi:Cdc6-like AAA superfamily ATPase
VRLEALEVPFEVRCTGSGAADLARSVAAAWDWCIAGTAYDDGDESVQRLTVVLEPDIEELARMSVGSSLFAQDLPTLMDRLSPMVTRAAVNERRRELVMFHACAVADPVTGDAVVLYGPSGTGKTTLARTLCTDLVYLSDETAAVAPDLRIAPYPKPLSILVNPGDSLKEQVSPGRLGLVPPGGGGYRLRALIQLRRDPAHEGVASLESLATVDALPELVAQTSYTRDLERPLHHLAELAHRVGDVRRATYAEAEQLRPVVRALLDGDA